MLSPQQQDKKLVKEYKKTNKILRKQLEALNQQIDNLILQKSNRIGLEKLPKVQKQITDVKVIHYEVENLKKRLQHIKHDNEEYKKKNVVDWLQKSKQLQKKLQQKLTQKESVQNKIKVYEKKLNEEKSEVNLRKQQQKILQKIQAANNQLTRVKKIEKDLRLFVSTQVQEDSKKAKYLQQLQTQQQEILKKSQALQPKKSVIEPKPIQTGKLPDYEWEKLKKDFLELKEAKQQEEIFLYEQNDRLRREIKFLSQQIKVKKNRVDVVKKYNTLEPSEKKLSSRLQKLSQRNTIDASNNSETKRKRGFSSIDGAVKHQSVRYRDRNNSVSYQ